MKRDEVYWIGPDENDTDALKEVDLDEGDVLGEQSSEGNYFWTIEEDKPEHSPYAYLGYWGEYRLQLYLKENAFSHVGHDTTLYYETHRFMDNPQGLTDLIIRGRSILSEIVRSDKYTVCPHCNKLVKNPDKGNVLTRDKSILPTPRADYTRLSYDNKDTTYCVGLTSYWPPRFKIYKHHTETNLFFSKEELEECETLCRAQGKDYTIKDYPNPHNLNRLKYIVENHPEHLKTDIDGEQLKRVMDALFGDDDIDSLEKSWEEKRRRDKY